MSDRQASCAAWQQIAAETCAVLGPQTIEDGSVVVLLLDDERRPTGRSLIRSVSPRLDVHERVGLLAEAVHVLRHGHPAGEVASQCLLLTFGAGHGELDSTPRNAWWPALQDACRAADLLPVDVVPVEPLSPVQ